MIMTRTPFRVSFFGGGTDYPAWYAEHGGAVLATTIDKYCYLLCRYLPPFFDARYRTVYSRTELTATVDEIEHPAVRACLRYLQFEERGTEIVHYSDLPSRTGVGSSSAFTVGLLHALAGLKHEMLSKRQLAEIAIHIEQRELRENVGSQDQVCVAFGGLNVITFGDRGFEVKPVTLSYERLRLLEESVVLIYTGISRNASEVAAEQIRNMHNKTRELHEMRAMVDHATDILVSDRDISDFGRLLHESWMLKSSLSPRISNNVISDIYQRARVSGAIGGKLLGAGGGGFLLLFVSPGERGRLLDALPNLLHVPIRFEELGTQVIYFQRQPEQ